MKIHNYSPGPSKLPECVIKKIQAEFHDYQSKGVSVVEISHRSALFLELYYDVIRRFRNVLNIPEKYHVLLLPGGCSFQYSMLPLNFIEDKKAAYIDTGIWSKKALSEAQRLKKIDVIASGEKNQYQSLPELPNIDVSQYHYLHYTSNNTIYGTEFRTIPAYNDLPLVVDATSNIFSHEIDVSQFALIYGGVQKNLSVSGLGFAILNPDLKFACLDQVPKLMQYQTYIDNESMFNTPNTFAIYVTQLVLEWIEEQGGISALEQINIKKSNMIYDIIDSSDLYINTIKKTDRSRMNICFRLTTEELEKKFIQEAQAIGIEYIKGHRLAGGIRLSMYNAMPLSSIEFLSLFMLKFQNNNQ